MIAVILDHSFRITTHQCVSFFFILSGFVLALSYSNILLTPKVFARFSIARIARLWPSHAFCLVLLAALVPELYKFTKGTAPLFFTNLFLLQAWIPDFKVFFSYNAPAWASSVLIFMSLSFPFLMVAMRKSWKLTLVGCAVPLVGLIIFCNQANLPEASTTGLSLQGLLYVNPLSRLFEFAMGIAAALLFHEISRKKSVDARVSSFLELAAIASMVFGFVFASKLQQITGIWLGPAGGYWMRNVGSTLLPCCLLFFSLTFQRGVVSNALDNPVLRFLGEITFSIYMLHAVLLCYRTLHFPDADPIVSFAVWLVTVLVGSVLMYEFFEKPTRKLILNIGGKLAS